MTAEPQPPTLGYARHAPPGEGHSLLRLLGIYAIVYGVITTGRSIEWFYGAIVGYGSFVWAVANPFADYSTYGASALAALGTLLGGWRILQRGDTRLFSLGLIASTTLAVARALLQLQGLLQSNLPPERITAFAVDLLVGSASAVVTLWMITRLVRFSKALQDAQPQARTETWSKVHRAVAWLVIVPPLASLLGKLVMAVQHTLWPVPQRSVGISSWLSLAFSAIFALAGALFYSRWPRARIICTVLAVISVAAPLIWWCARFSSWQHWKTVLISVPTILGAHTVLNSVPLATLLVLLLTHPRLRSRNG